MDWRLGIGEWEDVGGWRLEVKEKRVGALWIIRFGGL